MVTENVHVILWYVFFIPATQIALGGEKKKSKQDKAGPDKTTGCSSPALLQHFSLVLESASRYLAASKQWILIKEQRRNSHPSVRLLKSSMLACTTESIKPQTPGGAAAVHEIIH